MLTSKIQTVKNWKETGRLINNNDNGSATQMNLILVQDDSFEW